MRESPARRRRVASSVVGDLPGAVVERAERYLAGVDGAAPTLLVALHVVGSAVLDDYRPCSDLDVVVALARQPSAADLAALAAAHRADPGVEALYVPDGSLAGPPDAVEDGPWSADGELHTGRSFQLNPVTWAQLGRHAVTLRGTRPRPPVDNDAVRAFCTANLAEYWAPTLDHVAAVIADRADDAPADAGTVEWVALGPPRLWHTVRSGEIVSKTRAGELAAAAWPGLAAPLADILAVRRGDGVAMTTAHARAAVTLGRRILDTTR